MRMTPENTLNQTKLLAKISFPKILGVTFSLFFLFTSRCLYDFISAFGQFHVVVESGTTSSALFTFIAFCLWEIIPTMLVLLLFGTVAPTRLGALSKKRDSFFIKNPSIKRHPNPNTPFESGLTTSLLKSASDFPESSDDSTTVNDSSSDDDGSFKKPSPMYYGSFNSPYSVTPPTFIQNKSDV